MDVCPDYEDLFKILNAYKIRYLLVGGQAVIFYSEPRYTKDIDIWIPPDLNDPENVYRALKEFGAPLYGLTKQDFCDKKLILQIGVPPVRIDLMMSVPGLLSAKRAWRARKMSHYGKTRINIVDISDLIKAKAKAGRSMDKVDLEKLVDRKKRLYRRRKK